MFAIFNVFEYFPIFFFVALMICQGLLNISNANKINVWSATNEIVDTKWLHDGEWMQRDQHSHMHTCG